MAENKLTHSTDATNLADILERVLDKGIVVAGDIRVEIAEIELLSIKIRLMVASVDKALELGINWWENDPFLNTDARTRQLEEQNTELKKRLETLEKKLDQASSSTS
jgi:hypothetical protein